jgi:hypothetical protein
VAFSVDSWERMAAMSWPKRLILSPMQEKTDIENKN